MAASQIGVRTAYDGGREKHEKELMEVIARQNENPLQRAADKMLDAVRSLYSDYLYASGTMLMLWVWWGVYPSYARFRHANIMRFRRRKQWDFRRWFFFTRHVPRWDKKYLQRVEVPSFHAEQSLRAETTPATTVLPVGAQRSEMLAGSVEGMHWATDDVLVKVQTTPAASFASGSLEKMESCIVEGAEAINCTIRDSLKSKHILHFGNVDRKCLREEVTRLIKASRGVVVLQESAATRRSVPPGREVWWVSLEEAHRRREWWFWLSVLAAARVLQDLLDMPDMPHLVQ